MKTIISGGRNHTDPDIVDAAVRASGFTVTKVIEGGQRTYDEAGNVVGGVDWFARLWGEQNDVPVQTVEADWRKHGRAAGPIRNGKMLDEGAEQVIAIPDKRSRGTWDMVNQALGRNVPVYIYRGA